MQDAVRTEFSPPRVKTPQAQLPAETKEAHAVHTTSMTHLNLNLATAKTTVPSRCRRRARSFPISSRSDRPNQQKHDELLLNRKSIQ